MKYDIRIIYLIFIVYAFLGWLIEVILTFIRERKFVNRGFLIGPYCPVYGCGGILMIILLKRYTDDIVTLFIMCVLLFSILEYITSFLMEKLFNARWWDYSRFRFNINGRICLETMIPFGLFGIFMMYIVNPFLINFINKIPSILLTILSIIIALIFICDVIISSNAMVKIKGTIKKATKDNTEEITKKVKDIIMQKDYFKKRIIKAFPRFRIK